MYMTKFLIIYDPSEKGVGGVVVLKNTTEYIGLNFLVYSIGLHLCSR